MPGEYDFAEAFNIATSPDSHRNVFAHFTFRLSAVLKLPISPVVPEHEAPSTASGTRPRNIDVVLPLHLEPHSGTSNLQTAFHVSVVYTIYKTSLCNTKLEHLSFVLRPSPLSQLIGSVVYSSGKIVPGLPSSLFSFR